MPPKCLFSYDVISVSPRVARWHSSEQGFVDRGLYKYRLLLLGSVTFDLSTIKHKSMLILSFTLELKLTGLV